MHPLFLSHIVPNPSLRILPTISLVDSSFSSQLFQLTSPHVFETSCLHAWHGPYYHRWLWIISTVFTTPTLSRRASVDTPINQSHPTHPDQERKNINFCAFGSNITKAWHTASFFVVYKAVTLKKIFWSFTWFQTSETPFFTVFLVTLMPVLRLGPAKSSHQKISWVKPGENVK